jgi:hypothetical protein
MVRKVWRPERSRLSGDENDRMMAEDVVVFEGLG